MYLSARKFFTYKDSAWGTYVGWIGLPNLAQVRTMDVALNPYAVDTNPIYMPSDMIDIPSEILSLPEIHPELDYYLLAINLDEETIPFLPNDTKTLGHDLADETLTSSILNCGPWQGKLAAIAKRVNEHGLLSFDDARLAQKLLPEEWGEEEPHAYVDIWALYEVSALRIRK